MFLFFLPFLSRYRNYYIYIEIETYGIKCFSLKNYSNSESEVNNNDQGVVGDGGGRVINIHGILLSKIVLKVYFRYQTICSGKNMMQNEC